MRSATLWTSGWDLDNKTLYYHKQHNRRVRRLDVGAIDFSKAADSVVKLPLDREKRQDVEDMTGMLK